MEYISDTSIRIRNSQLNIIKQLGVYDNFLKAIRQQKQTYIRNLEDRMGSNTLEPDAWDLIVSLNWSATEEGFMFWAKVDDDVYVAVQKLNGNHFGI